MAEAARDAAAKAKAEAEAAKKTVEKFLRARGFKDLRTPRKALFCGPSALPLHVAVEEGHVETVRAMLCCGADKAQKNSAKLSALDLAERRNKHHSHDAIVELLRA
jgi:ankyrin repeat protein